MGVLKQYLAAWAAFASLLKCALSFFVLKKPGGRRFQPVCCVIPPDTVRARTDPYIYSQGWLHSRGVAVTWDNPDFSLTEVETGRVIRGDIVQPNTSYRVDVSVHNHSRMAAIATTVLLQWHEFGAVLPATTIGVQVADIPPVGMRVVSFEWTTPLDKFHICLDAILSQADDANPLNNIGQHNVFLAGPLDIPGRVPFPVGNFARDGRTYTITLDSYRLPDAPLHPTPPSEKALKTPPRSGLDYLLALQAANDALKFPVPEILRARTSDFSPQVPAGETRSLVVEFDPAIPVGRTPLNVNVTHDGRLVGGVTIYTGKSTG